MMTSKRLHSDVSASRMRRTKKLLNRKILLVVVKGARALPGTVQELPVEFFQSYEYSTVESE